MGTSLFVCPYHGRIDLEHVTTIKSCGLCMDEWAGSAAMAPALERAEFSGTHEPRYRFDCTRCKFAWCCGPRCACQLHGLGPTPKWRRAEVRKSLRLWMRTRER